MTRPKILVVDDEPDIHVVTKMALKSMRYRDEKIKLLSAHTGAEAIDLLRENPDIGVVLMDVVMESQDAGLDAVKAIREELGNTTVRILLRTGQPGAAPERDVIDGYDLDGYLAKAELTSIKIYSAVRTALKAHGELVALARHQQVLASLHAAAVSLRAYEPFQTILQRILQAAVQIYPTPLAVLKLEVSRADGAPEEVLLHVQDPEDEPVDPDTVVAEIEAGELPGDDLVAREDGLVVPLRLHRQLGSGWLYLRGDPEDELARQVLPLLASHAANALYSNVAQANLEAREGPFFESISI